MRWEVTGGDSGHDDLGCTTRYAIRTARPRLVRVRRTLQWWPPGQAALRLREARTRTQEAGTRTPYVRHGCGTSKCQHN